LAVLQGLIRRQLGLSFERKRGLSEGQKHVSPSSPPKKLRKTVAGQMVSVHNWKEFSTCCECGVTNALNFREISVRFDC